MAMLLGVMAAAAAAAQAPADCQSTLCYVEALQPFLARLRESRPESGRPIHIVQIGDSHTAGDTITNGWRMPLQQRYGHGGRGVLAAGRPYRGYLTWGVTASQSPGWSVNAIFGGRYTGETPIGLSGFTQTARAAGETLGVATDSPDQDFDRIIVCAVRQPGAGTIVLRMAGIEQRWELDAPARAPACRTMDSERPVSAASITTGDDHVVSITSFATFRKAGGVALSNLGVSGSQLIHLGRADDAVMRAEFDAYRADLIVLAFGTNEGFSPRLGGAEYEAGLRRQVARIRRLAGRDVPILLLAAPDAETPNPALAANGGGPARPCGEGWYTPNLLGEVRARQKKVARDMRLGFWDWNAAMGGTCSAISWRGRDWMRGDHVHFTKAGGLEIGRLLFSDVERAAASPPTY